MSYAFASVWQARPVPPLADQFIFWGSPLDYGPVLPSRLREFHPEALTDSGREPLDSSGSCHRVETAVSRQDRRFLPFPVALPILSSVTHPLRSTGITLPHRYYGVVRPWLAHPYCRPHGFPACAFSVTIAHQVLKFHTKARMRFTLPIHRTPHGQ